MTHTPWQDDFAAVFQIDDRPVRGRIVRLGAGSLSPILQRHDYPEELARLLGEAVTLAALVGTSLKFEGRLLVQAEGDGPVSMLVGEYTTGGGLRGYARYDADAWAKLETVNKGARPHMPQLFGPSGRLALIIIQNNPATQPYQGIVPLIKGTLSECAEDYFLQSEQIPTKIKLSVGQAQIAGETPVWRGGGLMVQRIAGDVSRGDTDDAWREAEALMGTLRDDELIDPALSAPDLLFRLFHEAGVRMEAAQTLNDCCTCNHERLKATLAGMPDTALHEMVEPDGCLSVDCQFCGRHYSIPINDVTGAVN